MPAKRWLAVDNRFVAATNSGHPFRKGARFVANTGLYFSGLYILRISPDDQASRNFCLVAPFERGAKDFGARPVFVKI
jgi:hypothetical protein